MSARLTYALILISTLRHPRWFAKEMKEKIGDREILTRMRDNRDVHKTEEGRNLVWREERKTRRGV